MRLRNIATKVSRNWSQATDIQNAPISAMDCTIVIDEPLFNGIDQPEIKVQHPQVNGPIMKHIPKSAKISCANLIAY